MEGIKSRREPIGSRLTICTKATPPWCAPSCIARSSGPKSSTRNINLAVNSAWSGRTFPPLYTHTHSDGRQCDRLVIIYTIQLSYEINDRLYSSEKKNRLMYKDFVIISSCHLMKWFFDIPYQSRKKINEMMWSPSVFDDICDVPGRANIVVKERKKKGYKRKEIYKCQDPTAVSETSCS